MKQAMKFVILMAFGISISDACANANEVKCLFPLAFKSSMNELIPEFEVSSGNKVAIDYGTIGALTARLKKDEVADVAIVSDKQFDELQMSQKLVAGFRADIAK